MPTPGVSDIPLSMSALVVSPAALSPSMICVFVTPAGSFEETKPSKTRLMAWPSSRGPSTVNSTLNTGRMVTTTMRPHLRPEAAQQPLGRRAEVHRLLGWHPRSAERPAAHGPSADGRPNRGGRFGGFVVAHAAA